MTALTLILSYYEAHTGSNGMSSTFEVGLIIIIVINELATSMISSLLWHFFMFLEHLVEGALD